MTMPLIQICNIFRPWDAPPSWASDSADKTVPIQMPPIHPGSKPAMADIHDIKPALAMGPDLQWLYWALAILALLALTALVWRLWQKRKRPETLPAAPPPIPPEAEALGLLDDLAAEGGLDPKRFYFRLSAIVRRYVERRFQIPAAEMTSEELIPRIDRLPLSAALIQPLKSFCRGADPIKFAGAVAEQSRMTQDLAFARDFVQQTTVPPEPPKEDCD